MTLDRPRFHAGSVLAAHIHATLQGTPGAHEVVTSSDITLDLSGGGPALTVVRATARPIGYARWAYSTTITLVTHGATLDDAWGAHAAAADVLLAGGAAFDSPHIISGASCTQEPDELVGRPQDWAAVSSTYTAVIRST